MVTVSLWLALNNKPGQGAPETCAAEVDNSIMSPQQVLFSGCTGWGIITLMLATINDTSPSHCSLGTHGKEPLAEEAGQ